MWWNQFHAAQYGSGQGKGILIAGMAPDLSYDNTCSERLNFSGMKWPPIYFTEIVLVFVRFLCRNFSFYFVLVFWITIILVLVLWKWRPITLVLVLIFVTKMTLADVPLRNYSLTHSSFYDARFILRIQKLSICRKLDYRNHISPSHFSHHLWRPKIWLSVNNWSDSIRLSIMQKIRKLLPNPINRVTNTMLTKPPWWR